MRKLTALVAGMILAMTALPAVAGVVITQKQHVSNGTNSRDSVQTISVQGNKQRMETERHTIITDLDNGQMYVLDPKAKTYFQIEFPPKGRMAAMMAASTNAAMNFKKAGSTREIAGYKCLDYDGGGHLMQGDYTVKECFSSAAPGAAEFAAFEKNMASKLSTSGTGEIPAGIPLAMDSSMKMSFSIPSGMNPDQAAKIKDMIDKRPPIVTSTVVEKVEMRKLSSTDFELPAGYTKAQLPQPGAMMAPSAGASPAAH
jgi:hypothetical protein